MMPYIFWIGALVCLLAGNYQWLQDNKQTVTKTERTFIVVDQNGQVIWSGINVMPPSGYEIRTILKETKK